MRHRVVQRLLVGGQQLVERRIRLGVDRHQVAFDYARGRRQSVDRRRIVAFDRVRQGLVIGPQAVLQRLGAGDRRRKDAQRRRLLRVGQVERVRELIHPHLGDRRGARRRPRLRKRERGRQQSERQFRNHRK
jgi:hypothetical protein